MKYFSCVVLVGLVFMDGVDGGPVKTCSEQGPCLDFTIEEVVATTCDFPDTNCAFKICVTYVANDGTNSCIKSPESFSHVCGRGFSFYGENYAFNGGNYCVPSSDVFEGDSDKNEDVVGADWELGSTYCEIVAPGKDFIFIAKDGGGQSCGTTTSYNETADDGTTLVNCDAFETVSDVGNCGANQDKECHWSITAPDTCDNVGPCTEVACCPTCESPKTLETYDGMFGCGCACPADKPHYVEMTQCCPGCDITGQIPVLLDGNTCSCECPAGKVLSYGTTTEAPSCIDELTDCTSLDDINGKTELVTIDFETFSAGQTVATLSVGSTGYTPFTVTTANTGNDPNWPAMIYNSSCSGSSCTGEDDDLGVGLGNILIISEDGLGSDPDDSALGGEICIDFSDQIVFVGDSILVDDYEITSKVTVYDNADCSGTDIFDADISGTIPDGEFGTLPILTDGAKSMKITFGGSGAIGDLQFCVCPNFSNPQCGGATPDFDPSTCSCACLVDATSCPPGSDFSPALCRCVNNPEENNPDCIPECHMCECENGNVVNVPPETPERRRALRFGHSGTNCPPDCEVNCNECDDDIIFPPSPI
mmetsp:Transcript_16884/g.21888  ORF Transcript_16884/g.21888 Transcript_16884/m.21888 type:complete len:592 (+) Transcript_16884:83-1858(+)|eukprot:CAMPEP_0197285382 /NCGR_PEP_ID=MMETSP0890-20130614/608_1 /TAXON_ID=44058 ORGANISM="Aureoumbra lagunensis, Strain CCMP1510" /NCGR_SAMPLE_ID=MMETSP0890 /ASSEMBLY_ACC=CAM_ASM_000533 /LENGTH=591 /DNA_ID=CAMNT_0042752805 /DNA_START=43 /DNA_END=1818 /DNA_ORIENTATION=-